MSFDVMHIEKRDEKLIISISIWFRLICSAGFVNGILEVI